MCVTTYGTSYKRLTVTTVEMNLEAQGRSQMVLKIRNDTLEDILSVIYW